MSLRKFMKKYILLVLVLTMALIFMPGDNFLLTAHASSDTCRTIYIKLKEKEVSKDASASLVYSYSLVDLEDDKINADLTVYDGSGKKLSYNKEGYYSQQAAYAEADFTYNGISFEELIVYKDQVLDINPTLEFTDSKDTDVYANGSDSYKLSVKDDYDSTVEYSVEDDDADITDSKLTCSGNSAKSVSVTAKLKGKDGTLYAQTSKTFAFQAVSAGSLTVKSINGSTKLGNNNSTTSLNPTLVISYTGGGLTESLVKSELKALDPGSDSETDSISSISVDKDKKTITIKYKSDSLTGKGGNHKLTLLGQSVSFYVNTATDETINDKGKPVISLTCNTEEKGTVINKKDKKVKLYNGNVTYSLTVEDPYYKYKDENNKTKNIYSGLASVSWEITDSHGSKNSKLLTKTSEKTDFDDTTSKKCTLSLPVNVGSEYEDNNIKIKITAVDKAGNKKTYTQYLAIDNYLPRVSASYSNNNVANASYFKAGRKLTVVVTDLNFNKKKSKSYLRSEVGSSGWIETGSNEYTSTITYSAEGSYTLKMAACDKAGNAASIGDQIWSSGTQAAWAFTIDKTAPVITLAYDNTKPKNDKYYKEARKITVSVVDKNFSSADTIVDTDGSVGAFNGTNNTYTSIVSFDKDGTYDMTASSTDLAGNQAVSKSVEEFIVDLTDPVIEITEVEDQKSYTGQVKPIIKIVDNSCDENSCKIKLTVTKLDETENVKAKYTVNETEDGLELDFDDIAHTEDNDGVYKLKVSATDLAGRKADTQTIEYSVNRNGTVYAIEDTATKKIIGTTTSSANVPDIRIRAYNADDIESAAVFVNDKELTSEQFTSRRVSSKGWYCYEYSIASSNFGSSGTYDVTISTADKAGNASMNDDSTHKSGKEASINFTVDNEAPTGSIQIAGLDNDTVKGESADLTATWSDSCGVTKVVIYVDDEEYKTLEGDELDSLDGSYDFTLEERPTDYTVSAEISDAAGNMYVVDKQTFLINTSFWKIVKHNKDLFRGILAVAVLIAVLVGVIIVRKKMGERE